MTKRQAERFAVKNRSGGQSAIAPSLPCSRSWMCVSRPFGAAWVARTNQAQALWAPSAIPQETSNENLCRNLAGRLPRADKPLLRPQLPLTQRLGRPILFRNGTPKRKISKGPWLLLKVVFLALPGTSQTELRTTSQGQTALRPFEGGLAVTRPSSSGSCPTSRSSSAWLESRPAAPDPKFLAGLVLVKALVLDPWRKAGLLT